MTERQKRLFNILVRDYGVGRSESEFLVKFREITVKAFLDQFKKPRWKRCLHPECPALLDAPRVYCDDHAFTMTLGFDLAAWKREAGIKH